MKCCILVTYLILKWELCTEIALIKILTFYKNLLVKYKVESNKLYKVTNVWDHKIIKIRCTILRFDCAFYSLFKLNLKSTSRNNLAYKNRVSLNLIKC